jgi:hypothetical protein
MPDKQSTQRQGLRKIAAALVLAAAAAALPAQTKPLASLAEFASSHHIDIGPATSAGGPGTTMLCFLDEGGLKSQWLVAVSAAKNADADSGSPTGMGILGAFSGSLRSSTGRDYNFPDQPVSLEVRCAGPFQDTPGATGGVDGSTSLTANKEYLSTGLFRIAQAFLRIRNEGRKPPQISYLFHASYSKEQIEADQKSAREAGFTADDDREYAKALFALTQFGYIAFLAPGVEEMLGRVLDPPTLFSGSYINIDWGKVTTVDPRPFGISRSIVVSVPFSYSTKTTVSGTLYFTEPKGPLESCAGILEISFEHSQKAPNTTLVMRASSWR